MDMMAIRRRVLLGNRKKEEGLPDVYQRVTVIQNYKVGGTPYINTGIIPNKNMRIVVKGITSQNVTSAGFIFGSRASSSKEKFWFLTWRTEYRYGLFSKANSFITTTSAEEEFDCDFNFSENHSVKVNNVVVEAGTVSDDTYTHPIYIFAVNNNGKPDSTQSMSFRLRSFKIYNHYNDANPSMDLIPCYRKSDDEVGMYDTVSKTFFTNAGTATFLKGADV